VTGLDISALVLAFGYAILQVRWYLAWQSMSTVSPPAGRLTHDWTVIIAARNEANSIQAVVRDVLAQAPKAPHCIVVDDHSIDNTADLAREAGADCLVLPKGETGKKAALQAGIQAAASNWIATLDADCRVSKDWLSSIDSATSGAVAVAGPVQLVHDNSLLQRWQSLDFMGMMVITGASLQKANFAMGNGANLAFSKAAFQEVGGYTSPKGKALASGDDMVLLGKLRQRFPGQIAFAKTPHAIVHTSASSSFGAFASQRLRWSAKTGLNLQVGLTLVLAWTWAFHLGLLLGIFCAAVGWLNWSVLAVGWVVKLSVDYLVLRAGTRFFGAHKLLDIFYPIASLLHAVYVAGIGTLALLPVQFDWKGRRHRH